MRFPAIFITDGGSLFHALILFIRRLSTSFSSASSTLGFSRASSINSCKRKTDAFTRTLLFSFEHNVWKKEVAHGWSSQWLPTGSHSLAHVSVADPHVRPTKSFSWELEQAEDQKFQQNVDTHKRLQTCLPRISILREEISHNGAVPETEATQKWLTSQSVGPWKMSRKHPTTKVTWAKTCCTNVQQCLSIRHPFPALFWLGYDRTEINQSNKPHKERRKWSNDFHFREVFFWLWKFQVCFSDFSMDEGCSRCELGKKWSLTELQFLQSHYLWTLENLIMQQAKW